MAASVGGRLPPSPKREATAPCGSRGPRQGAACQLPAEGPPRQGADPLPSGAIHLLVPLEPHFLFEVQEAKITEAKINEARENYRPAAERASLLYFILNDLNKINPIYQFSLKVWLRPGSGAGGLESTEPPAVRTAGVRAADRGGKREPGHGICSRPAPRGGAPLPVPQTPTRRGNKTGAPTGSTGWPPAP